MGSVFVSPRYCGADRSMHFSLSQETPSEAGLRDIPDYNDNVSDIFYDENAPAGFVQTRCSQQNFVSMQHGSACSFARAPHYPFSRADATAREQLSGRRRETLLVG